MSLAARIFIHVIFPLFIGLIIYLLFREDSWFHDQFDFVKKWQVDLGEKNFFEQILAFQLPDFCWTWSFTAALFIWESSRAHIRYFTLLVFVLVISSELIQYLIPGSFTADWKDLLATVIAFTLSALLNHSHEKI